MAIIIKGRLLDANDPTICVPVMDADAADIIGSVKRLVDSKVEMIEWRADFFDSLHDVEKLKKLLFELRDMTRDVILLVTIRTESQGGQCRLSEQELKKLLVEISQTHCADLIDVEYFSFSDPEKVIDKLHERGALLVVSHHDFSGTPSFDLMASLLEQMRDADADIVKLAVMPKSMQDVCTLLSVTSDFYEKNPTIPAITMSMGSMGVPSRVMGYMFGSCVTFASEGKAASAPGQLPFTDLSDIYKKL